jgi:hypothetical protein
MKKACNVARLLNARVVEPEKQPLLNNGYVKYNSLVTVESGVFYVVHADSYVM